MNSIASNIMRSQIDYFYDLIQQHRLVHGYALTGEDTAGKIEATVAVSMALGCDQLADNGHPCGVCDHCVRAKQGQLADMVHIQPDGQTIRVDQIRELKEWLAMSSMESGFKLAIIEEAHKMNASSANALLTFLEEPTANVYLFLLTQSTSLLLPTIQSRVQQVHFAGASEQSRMQLYQEQGVSEYHAQLLGVMSQDVASRAASDYDQGSFSDWLNTLNRFYSALIHGSASAMILVQSSLKPYLTVQQALDGMDYLMMLNHGMVRRLAGTATDELVVDYVLKELTKNSLVSLSHALTLQELLLSTKQRLMANVSPQLALERLAILASQ